MKRKLLVSIFCLFALMPLDGLKAVKLSADEVVPTLKDEVVFGENFDSFEEGYDGESCYQDNGNVWFNMGTINAEVDANKMMNVEVQAVDPYGYSVFGAVGTNKSENLKALTPGEKYTFSIKITQEQVASASELYFEYKNTEWTGVKLLGDGSVSILGNATNAKYKNSILSFDFIAQDKCVISGEGSDPVYPYIKITGYKFDIGDVVKMDDVAIIRNRNEEVFSQDFESMSIGSKITDGNNFYCNSGTSITVLEKDGNKYGLVHKDGEEGNEVFSEFYLNRLPINDGVSYRLSFDVINEDNYLQFYVRYNDNIANNICVTYNKDKTVEVYEYDYILGGTYSNTHVTYDFIPSSKVNQNFWAQVMLIVKGNNGCDFAIDNIKIEPLNSATNQPKLEADNVEVSVNGTVSYSAKLIYGTDDERVLSSDEFLVDDSNLDLTKEGSYTVSLKVIDDNLNEYSKDIVVTVVDSIDSIEFTPAIKTTYKYGETLDLSNTEILVTMASGNTSKVSIPEGAVTGYNKNAIGSQIITLTYEGKSYTTNVIVEDYVSSIEINHLPNKVVYEVGDDLNTFGLSVMGTTASGITKAVEYDIDDYDFSTAGEKTITVKVGELTKSFTVTVNEKEDEPIPTPSEDNPEEKGCNGTAIPSVTSLGFILSLLLSKKRK